MDFSVHELKKPGWAKICQELISHHALGVSKTVPAILCSSFPASDSQPTLCVRETNLFKASAENSIALDWMSQRSHHQCYKKQPKRKEKAGELRAAWLAGTMHNLHLLTLPAYAE